MFSSMIMADDNNIGLDWKGYEEITRYIYETLGTEYGIKIKSYGTKSKVKGKSGVKHQIDVLTEQIDREKVLLTAIECKFWKRKVTKEAVMKLSETMRDADIASGIIVSKAGFTPDTLSFANHVGIRLVELREAGHSSGNGGNNIDIGILEIRNQVTIRRPNVISIDFGSVQITDETEIMRLRYPDNAFILSPEGRQIPFDRFINAYCIELRDKDKFLKTITIAYPPVKGKLIRKYSNAEVEIEKLVFSGFLAEIDASSKRSFLLVDQVWMIMKEIFGKNTFKLSKSGLLFSDTGESK